MKATGIVRKIDNLGRLVLPKQIRDSLQMHPEDDIEFLVNDDGDIVLTHYKPSCTFCNETEELTDYQDKKICPKCFGEILKFRDASRRYD